MSKKAFVVDSNQVKWCPLVIQYSLISWLLMLLNVVVLIYLYIYIYLYSFDHLFCSIII